MSLIAARALVLVVAALCGVVAMTDIGHLDGSGRTALAVAAACGVLAFLPAAARGHPGETNAADAPANLPPDALAAIPTTSDPACARCAARPQAARRAVPPDADAIVVGTTPPKQGRGPEPGIVVSARRGIMICGDNPVARSHFRALVVALARGGCPHAEVRLLGEPSVDEHYAPIPAEAAPSDVVALSETAVAVRSVPGAGHRRIVSGCVVWNRADPSPSVPAPAPAPAAEHVSAPAHKPQWTPPATVVSIGLDGCTVSIDDSTQAIVPTLAELLPRPGDEASPRSQCRGAAVSA